VQGLSLLIVVLVIWVIVFAPLAGWLARGRARSPVVWSLFGAVLGPAAATLLVLAPPGRCPVCRNQVVGWPQLCPTCGRDLRSQPIDVAREAAARRASLISTPADQMVGARAGPVPGAPIAGLDAGALPGRAATALGLRPTSVSAPFSLPPLPPSSLLPAESDGGPGILGSGVFVGGSESLQVGSRYLLARVGDELHALGPVHVSPATIAARVPLRGVAPTFVEDRLLLAPTEPGRGPELAFGGVRLERAVDIVRELRLGDAADVATEPPWIPDVPVGPKKGRARVRSAAAAAAPALPSITAPEPTAVVPVPMAVPVAPERSAPRRPPLAIQAGPYVLRARVIIVMALAVGLMAAGIVSLLGR
jgi:hypothetical protein